LAWASALGTKGPLKDTIASPRYKLVCGGFGCRR
jgi:hypothetical protein